MTRRPAAHTPKDGIPEERIPAILARAAELDRDRRDSITVDALRAAAVDAGISPSAVDAALAEYAAGLTTAPPTPDAGRERKPRPGRIRRFFRSAVGALRSPLKLGVTLFVLGLTGAAGEGMIVVGVAAWLLLSARLIWRNRPARRASPFVLSLVFMTVGLALGFVATEVDEDLIAMLFAFGAPLLILGSLVIKIRLPRRLRSGGRALSASPR